MFVVEELGFDGLAPVSMQIDGGECVGLNGESGCGKTRLLRALADMDVHTGTARLEGVAAEDMEASDWRRQVALLPAESQWWFDTVGEHLAADETVLSLLNVLGFAPDVLDWQISRCSSGEKQRLAIVRLLANQPRVLLLDEPTANLDPENTLKVEAVISRYIADRQAACLWVSHNLLQLGRIAGRRYRCIGGALCEVGNG